MRFSGFIAIAVLSGCQGKPVEPTTDGAVLVLPVVAQDVSPPLRDLAKLPRAVRDADHFDNEPVRRIPHPKMRPMPLTPQKDSITQDHFGPHAIATTSVSFEAQGAGMSGFVSGGVPPDTDGDIGPNHYVQIVNTSVTVFSRTGTAMMGPMDTNTVWSGFSGGCANTNDGDGTVRYDHLADRWVISQFSFGLDSGGNPVAPYYQCVAVSTTPDPTGTYARFQFNFDAFPDYPKIALWPDAYYTTFNMFPNTGFAGGRVCAMDRTKMLAGDTSATMQCFDAGASYGGLLVTDLDGKTQPAAGEPAGVIALDQNTDHAYWQLHVDFATPANSKFMGPQMITVMSYDPVCGGGTCIAQPGGVGGGLDSLADRAMNRFVYRKFADHESLLLSHSVTAGAGGGVRWYEFRNAAAPTVYQQGTYAPDGAYRWMPSVAMDAAGEIASVFTVSSSTQAPSIHYTAHATSDPMGMMGQGEGEIATGTGSQDTYSRWGDYASINIDPTDDCTFWMTHEYRGASTDPTAWQTKVAAFSLPGCNSFAVTAKDAEIVDEGGSASYSITTATMVGSPGMVTLAATGLPTGVTATFSPAAVASGSMAKVTLTATKMATLGATQYTVTGTSATGTSAAASVALTVNPPAPDSGGCCQASGGSPVGPGLLVVGVALVIGRRRRRAR